jgi:hypothetical protein
MDRSISAFFMQRSRTLYGVKAVTGVTGFFMG